MPKEEIEQGGENNIGIKKKTKTQQKDNRQEDTAGPKPGTKETEYKRVINIKETRGGRKNNLSRKEPRSMPTKAHI